MPLYPTVQMLLSITNAVRCIRTQHQCFAERVRATHGAASTTPSTTLSPIAFPFPSTPRLLNPPTPPRRRRHPAPKPQHRQTWLRRRGVQPLIALLPIRRRVGAVRPRQRRGHRRGRRGNRSLARGLPAAGRRGRVQRRVARAYIAQHAVNQRLDAGGAGAEAEAAGTVLTAAAHGVVELGRDLRGRRSANRGFLQADAEGRGDGAVIEIVAVEMGGAGRRWWAGRAGRVASRRRRVWSCGRRGRCLPCRGRWGRRSGARRSRQRRRRSRRRGPWWSRRKGPRWRRWRLKEGRSDYWMAIQSILSARLCRTWWQWRGRCVGVVVGSKVRTAQHGGARQGVSGGGVIAEVRREAMEPIDVLKPAGEM